MQNNPEVGVPLELRRVDVRPQIQPYIVPKSLPTVGTVPMLLDRLE